MSWSRTSRGTVDQVCDEIANGITQSVGTYDERLTAKGEAVAKSTGELIHAAAGEPQDGKELLVNCYGHVDHAGMSSYGLTVAHVYPEPEIKPITDEQFAAATGTTGETSGE